MAKANQPTRLVIPKAQSWNRVVEAADRVLSGSGFNADLEGLPRLEIKVVNKTGSDIDPHKIIALDGVEVEESTDGDAFRFDPVWKSKTSDADEDDFGRWGVTQEKIEADGIGAVVIKGITAVQVNIKDTDHLYADCFNSTDAPDKLTSATTGSARILTPQASTGDAWCLVDMGVSGPGLLLGDLDGDLAHDGTQTIDSSLATVSGDWMGDAKELVSGTKVGAMWDDGKWIVVCANACETNE